LNSKQLDFDKFSRESNLREEDYLILSKNIDHAEFLTEG